MVDSLNCFTPKAIAGLMKGMEKTPPLSMNAGCFFGGKGGGIGVRPH